MNYYYMNYEIMNYAYYYELLELCTKNSSLKQQLIKYLPQRLYILVS